MSFVPAEDGHVIDQCQNVEPFFLKKSVKKKVSFVPAEDGHVIDQCQNVEPFFLCPKSVKRDYYRGKRDLLCADF